MNLNTDAHKCDRRTLLKTIGATAAAATTAGVAAGRSGAGGDCSKVGERTYEGSLSGYGDDATHTHTVSASDPCEFSIGLEADAGTDFDLYVTLDGRTPSEYDYDRRSVGYGSDESVEVDAGEVGGSELGLMVDVYSGSGDYTLTVEEYGTGNGGGGGGGGGGETTDISFDIDGLKPLDRGYYEGWAVFGSEKVSTGKFRGDEGELEFSVDRDLTQADEVVVTIEPEDDPSAGPSGVVYLKGSVYPVGEDGARAYLEFPVDFGPDYSPDVSGEYILATPTNGGGSDETAGVWFLDPEGGPSAGLDLPDLPRGWTYEGWVVTQGRPITTGRFDDPAAADDAAPFSGPKGGPPFPGEDLLNDAPAGVQFPANIADGSSKVVITVEPDLDGVDPTGEKPFSVKPLVGDVPADLEDHTVAEMSADGARPAPYGTVPEGDAFIGETGSSCPVYCDDAGTGLGDLLPFFG